MGSLDEVNVSIWVGTTPETAYPHFGGSAAVDVAVLGGGIAGLSTALRLKQQGARVAVVEAGRIASGTTGYTTAKITSLHGLTYADLRSSFGTDGARAYGQAQQAGLGLVADWVAHLGIDCDFGRQPAYTYATSAEGLDRVHAEVDAAREAGLPASFTVEVDLPFEVTGAVRFDDQALFHPRKYCIALARAIEGDGSAVYELTRATGVREGDPCVVETERGELRADRVVVATHLPFLDRGLFFAKSHPKRSYALAVRTDRPTTGMYLSVEEPSRSIRPYSGDDASLLVIGGESHKVGQDDDERRHYEALESWSREHYTVASIDYRWSAQDYVPNDGVPFIGRLHRGTERLFVATGFRKWGMTNGSMAGILLSDLCLGRDNEWTELFDANRVKPAAQAKTFVKENLNVAKRFIGDRVGMITAPPADSLAPGQGGIVSLDGDRVAAYRDDDGALHALSPVCTHLGCIVAFNTAERSWDCPCHGSRFATDGSVIQGPATKDLEPHRTKD